MVQFGVGWVVDDCVFVGVFEVDRCDGVGFDQLLDQFVVPFWCCVELEA